jgi:hypothetical protein
VQHVSVYETWAPDRVTEIFAAPDDGKDVEEDEWVSVWRRQSPALGTEHDATIANVDDINTCGVGFKTRYLKLAIEIESNNHWYAIDAVAVTGVEALAKNVVMGDTILFRPKPDANGLAQGEHARAQRRSCVQAQKFPLLLPRPMLLVKRSAAAAILPLITFCHSRSLGHRPGLSVLPRETNYQRRRSVLRDLHRCGRSERRPSIPEPTFIDLTYGSGCVGWEGYVCFDMDTDPERYRQALAACTHAPEDCTAYPLSAYAALELQEACPAACRVQEVGGLIAIELAAGADEATSVRIADLVSDVDDNVESLVVELVTEDGQFGSVEVSASGTEIQVSAK